MQFRKSRLRASQRIECRFLILCVFAEPQDNPRLMYGVKKLWEPPPHAAPLWILSRAPSYGRWGDVQEEIQKDMQFRKQRLRAFERVESGMIFFSSR